MSFEVKLLWPVPRALSRPLARLLVLVWLVQMGFLAHRACWQSTAVSLAADLSRYGSAARWKGVYYRGDKIGFMVTETVPLPDGFELREDGRLQMALLGATSAAKLSTRVVVDRAFALRSFAFSLDPGSGPLRVEGSLLGRRLHLTVTGASGSRSEDRELPEAPALSLNLSRQLAAQGLRPGTHREIQLFDPATLRNAAMSLDVQAREIVSAAGRPVPAFRVVMRFAGITSTAWVTDTGETVREESPLGLIVVTETRERATAMAVPGAVRLDLLEAAAVVPDSPRRIDDPTTVRRIRLRLEGPDLSGADLQGAGQSVRGDQMEIRDARFLKAEPTDPDLNRYLHPEPFLESDAPEIVEEAIKATAGAIAPRARAEKLLRHVAGLLEKKPTVSLPSAREVLRTKVGDCNEHTALYVAMARAAGLPARIAVGLVYLRGAFYYHAWPEVYLAEGPGRGLWLPVDPTLNQFPADATHIRLVRGGLDRQASILPLIGRTKITILDLELAPGSTPVLVGRPIEDPRPLDIPIPRRDGSGRGCWSVPG